MIKGMMRRRKGKGLTYLEIGILVLSTFAFSYMLASAIPGVSAGGTLEGKCFNAGGKLYKVHGLDLVNATTGNTIMSINTFCENGGNNGPGYVGVLCGLIRDKNRYYNLDTARIIVVSCSSQPPPTNTPAAAQTPISGSDVLRAAAAAQAAANAGTAAVQAVGRATGIGGGHTAPAAGGKTTTTNPAPTPPPAISNSQWLAENGALNWKSARIIAQNLGWSLLIYGATRWIFGYLGSFAAENAGLAGFAAATGFFSATTVLPLVRHIFGWNSGFLASAGFAWGVGILIAIGIFIFGAKQTRYYAYQFTCYPWDAPTGGANCQQCNQGNIPCTEYRCRSLGQGCVLANQGTGEELCVWNNSQDVTPPEITPLLSVLSTAYKYVPDNSISPPDNGVRIVPVGNNSGCIKPWVAITFGVGLNEPGRCKIDIVSQSNFDAMQNFFGGSSTVKYNHTQLLKFPDPNSLDSENITIEPGQTYSLYTRCQDTNRNANVANFVFKFCVDNGPDTTPPEIVSTSIFNNSPILYNQSSVDLQVYTNEPSECRWSKTDQDYSTMENDMSCSTGVFDMNAQALYPCSTTLTGLKSGQDNTFYFRCLDQPYLKGTANESQRNANSQSYQFTLVGTQPLVIDSVGPNGTIKDSTDVIKVTLTAQTSAGYDHGKSLCYYNGSGTNNQFIQFYPEEGNYQHSQDLYLSPGDYTYDIRCIDLGGNTDTESTSFTVQSDTQAPIVVRAYHDESSLDIVTNENASCVYSTTASSGCSYDFDKGIQMQTLDGTHQETNWDTSNTFYIKCEDGFGNQPAPDQCSIVVTPYAAVVQSSSSS